MLAFMIVACATPLLHPALQLLLWITFFPICALVLWRLRCWNCGDRLLRDGGAHLEMCKTGVLRWDMCRHKTCGADLH